MEEESCGSRSRSRLRLPTCKYLLTVVTSHPPARAALTQSSQSTHSTQSFPLPRTQSLTRSSHSLSHSLNSLHHHPIILFVVFFPFPGLSLSCPHIPNSYVHYYYQYFPHFPFICSNYLRISLLLRLNSFYLPSLTFFFFTS